ncbi:MAG: hypothetical protein FIB02_02590 [Desulfuromonas sp.]|nr:hypothetical protein [Desulfuromonas sp.]
MNPFAEALWQVYWEHVIRDAGAALAETVWPEIARSRVRKRIHQALVKIRPENHVERVFAFWCGLYGRTSERDEYLRRRRGGKPALPDHPLLDLSDWNMPDTCRLIVFEEQRDALFRKLCDPLMTKGKISRRVDTLQSLMSEAESFQVFRSWLNPNLRQKLAEEEQATIYAAVWPGLGAGWGYCYHSVLVSRAEALAQKSSR